MQLEFSFCLGSLLLVNLSLKGGGGWGISGEIPWFSGGNEGRGILVVTNIVWRGEATEYWPSIKETGENNIEPYKGIR